MSAYQANDTRTLIGTKNAAGTRTGVALTSSYQAESGSVPTKSFATSNYNRATFFINYVMGATETANSIEARIEGSPDNVNWYRIPNDSTAGGTSTLVAREFTFVGADAAASTISILLDIGYPFMRISLKESGVVTNAGNAYAEVTLVQS